MPKDYYVILGVASNASGEDIKSAFRRRAMKLHPDQSGSESGPFLELQEAYGVLSDPQRRRHYDRDAHAITLRGRPWAPMAESFVRQRPSGEPFRPPASSRNFRPVPLAENFERESPRFDELFDRLWGHVESFSWPKSSTLESLTVEVVISQGAARWGGRVQIDIPAHATCPACGGPGAVGFYECWQCEGHGALTASYPLAVPYPPGVRDGYAVQIPLDRLGIANLHLTVLFRVRDAR